MIAVKNPDSIDEKVKYDSRQKETIAEALDNYGIPHLYNQPALVFENGKRSVEYTDFFLPANKGLSIDYIAGRQDTEYQRKTELYKDNQIPAVLVTETDLDDPDFGEKLYKTIEYMSSDKPYN